ncbi:MAG: LacI family DNA-binding transcriptional regulator [Planctomycetota bacterium]
MRRDTREKILTSAEKLGYRHNAAARAMRKGKFDALGLVVSDRSGRSIPMAGLLGGVMQWARDAGRNVSIAEVPDEKLTSNEYMPRILRELAVDGMLMNYISDVPGGVLDMIEQCRVPTVWINLKLEQDCIYPDDRGGAEALTRYILSRGHRRVAYVHARSVQGTRDRHPHYSEEDRQAGYVAAMIDAGLRADVREIDADPSTQSIFSDDGRMSSLAEMLRRPDRPTACICYSDATAIPLLAAAWQLGLNVPRDLSIASFRDKVPSGVGVEISSMQTSFRKIGFRGSEILAEKIECPETVVPGQAWKYRLVAGQTVGPAPSSG